MDRQEIFADDVQARFRQEMMDVGDAAGDRVLDRDHRKFGRAALDRVERVLEGRAGHRLHAGKHVAAGGVGIGAGFALECDAVGLGHAASALLYDKHGAGALEIFGRIDAQRNGIDEADIDAHARFERAQLLQPLARLRAGCGPRPTKRSSAARR